MTNFKNECLLWNKDLRCSRSKGTALYQIIIGSQGAHKSFSGFADTPSQAWKLCYFKNVVKHELLSSVYTYVSMDCYAYEGKCSCGKLITGWIPKEYEDNIKKHLESGL